MAAVGGPPLLHPAHAKQNACLHVLRSSPAACHSRDLYRYRNFLGIQREQANIAEEQARLKSAFRDGTDVAAPDNMRTIEAAKAEGTPADRCYFISLQQCCFTSLHAPSCAALSNYLHCCRMSLALNFLACLG